NGEPAVTWMCTPDQLEELATGWLHGEGYIETLDDLVKLRPCATDLGFWAEVKPERVTLVKGENRKRVLASGCGAVSTFLADPHAVQHAPERGEPPVPERLRALFKELFASGERYNETGGIHAAALTDGERLLFHAEDIGRHNAVDQEIGAAAILDGKSSPTLTAAAAEHAIDVVAVFRRREFVGPIVDEALRGRPRLIWLQVGVLDETAPARAATAGIPLVMDRCLMVDHQALGV